MQAWQAKFVPVPTDFWHSYVWPTLYYSWPIGLIFSVYIVSLFWRRTGRKLYVSTFKNDNWRHLAEGTAMTPQERRDQRRSVHRKYSMFILRIPRFVRDYGKVARTGPLLEFDPRLGDWADTKNPTHQLEFIRRVALEKIATTDTVKTLEFPTIADALKETTDGYCLVSKTNLATFLRPASGIGTLFEQSQARASLASITLPLAILYKAGELAASVEWVEQIDELELTVVREALKNAGIPTVKTAEADSAAELRHLLQRTLGLATN